MVERVKRFNYTNGVEEMYQNENDDFVLIDSFF